MSNKSKRITLEQRKTIEKMIHEGVPHREICKFVNIWPTTLYRDFKKCKGAYNAEEAHAHTGKSINLIDFDFIGKRFGFLKVEKFAAIYNKRSWWHCQCDCGKKCIMPRRIMMEYCSPNRPLSCGCVPKQSKGRGEAVPLEEGALRKWMDLLKFREIVGECWEWRGYVQKSKKGTLTPKASWRSHTMSVRKITYMVFNGMSPDQKGEIDNIYSTCDNPLCFNPDHFSFTVPFKKKGPYKKKTIPRSSSE